MVPTTLPLIFLATLAHGFFVPEQTEHFPQGLRMKHKVRRELPPPIVKLNQTGGLQPGVPAAPACGPCLMVRSSSTSVTNTAPWLYNQAKFYYSNLDGAGYSVFQANVGSKPYFLHFYDEGVFFNGFWIVNDTPGEYIETEGRVFVYNSEYDECPVDTGNNWYYFVNGDWKYDASISVSTC